MYEFAANLTLTVHFAFIIFVVFGALLFFILARIIYIHIPALIWGIYMELTHAVCPLTYLENWFLQKANLKIYKERYFSIRPSHEIRYGIKTLRSPFGKIPLIREISVLGTCYILKNNT